MHSILIGIITLALSCGMVLMAKAVIDVILEWYGEHIAFERPVTQVRRFIAMTLVIVIIVFALWGLGELVTHRLLGGIAGDYLTEL